MNPTYRLRALFIIAFCIATGARGHAQPDASSLAGLKQLSLEQLVSLDVSTVSRKEERWWNAPSGIDVVTGEEIRRAGALNLPDALRLAAGVHVGQPSARSWAVSLRGMNVLAANKISVAMDGRSLFTPFFSGVQWDAQDTLMEDIDRIEVVRGPVGALWGSFAVNGFIQILTKPAWDTQGYIATAGTGTQDPLFASFRYGGKVNDSTFYRVYAKYSQMDWTYSANGRRAQPATDFFQTGFRVDTLGARHTTLTVQGDYYTNQDLPLDRLQSEANGANILGRWRRTFSTDANLETEMYVERTYHLIPTQFEERRNTVSNSTKYRAQSELHDFMVGADALVSWDNIGNIGIARLEPSRRTTHTAGIFLQDALKLVPKRAILSFGIKAEHNTFTGVEYQPTIRLAWTPSPQSTLWSAVSRAVRTPVRIDEDLVFRFSGATFFEANDGFKSERTNAYEFGWRHQISSLLSIDVSTFLYRYDNIRSTEPLGSTPIPSTFRNMLNADSDGAEFTLMFQPIARLLFKGSYRYLHLRFFRDTGSRDNTNGSSEGNDPRHLANIGAHLTLPRNLELDGFLRYASALPNPRLPGYKALDLRAGWHASPSWELSITARNLLDAQHAEFVTTNSLNEQVHSSYTFKATWRY